MTDETTNADTTTDATASTDAATSSNINISIEQICAAIINTVGTVEVPLANLLENYGGKSIAVNQDPDTKAVTFSLADSTVAIEENEDESK